MKLYQVDIPMNKPEEKYTPFWFLESKRELGFVKGEKYYIAGHTWMLLEEVERILLDDGSAVVTYYFVGCAP